MIGLIKHYLMYMRYEQRSELCTRGLAKKKCIKIKIISGHARVPGRWFFFSNGPCHREITKIFFSSQKYDWYLPYFFLHFATFDPLPKTPHFLNTQDPFVLTFAKKILKWYTYVQVYMLRALARRARARLCELRMSINTTEGSITCKTNYEINGTIKKMDKYRR